MNTREEIQKRHDETSKISQWGTASTDWKNAHQDRDYLIKLVEAIEEACTEIQNDWAPEQPPYEAQELIREIRLLTGE